MRTTQLFGHTLRSSNSENIVISHDLLTRAGFIHQTGAGIFTYLHLAKKTIAKIENIIRQELEAIGGQEISMPFVNPADLLKETSEKFQSGKQMGRFKERNSIKRIMSSSHEEIIGNLIRHEIHSYKQLPQLVFSFQKNWCDDPGPQSGPIQLRELSMAKSFSIDANEDDLDRQYRAHYKAFNNIFNRCDLPIRDSETDGSLTASTHVLEFIFPSPTGEEIILFCPSCGYKANQKVASFKKGLFPLEEPKKLEKVFTPGAHTIERLCELLKISKNQTAKAVFLVAEIPSETGINEKFIFAVVRGDMDLNETKLKTALHASEIRPARDDEIRVVGAVPGFASPIGLKDVFVIVDDIIPASANLVSGANEKDYHFLNVNYQRDFKASQIMDLVMAKENFGCPCCGAPLKSYRGVEVGKLSKLGSSFDGKVKCEYLSQDGSHKEVILGSYSIGIERLLACIVEQHHDQKGIIWPESVAPFQIHIILLRGKGNEKNVLLAEKIYTDLKNSGLEVLFDDGPDSPGVKFNNADLIGCPIRITISDHACAEGGVEIKLRHLEDRKIIPTENFVEHIKQLLDSLKSKKPN